MIGYYYYTFNLRVDNETNSVDIFDGVQWVEQSPEVSAEILRSIDSLVAAERERLGRVLEEERDKHEDRFARIVMNSAIEAIRKEPSE